MHIYFDLDGTLLQTGETTLLAARAVYEELGIDGADDGRILESIGRPMDEFLRNILPDHIPPEAVRERYRCLERQAIREHGKLFPGIEDVLGALCDDGHRLFICSNGSIGYIELALESTGIRAYFSDMYSAANHRSKTQRMSMLLKSGEQAVFIGDSYDDMEAGVMNKIPAVAALYGYGRKDLLRGAPYAVGSPEEITGAVRRIAVYSAVAEMLVKTGRRVMGINGVDTSGKTEFTKSFARYLQSSGYACTIIHMDDFHNPLAVRRQGSDELDAYYTNAFNDRQLTEELLMPLKVAGHVDKDVVCLNLDTDKYENVRHYKADRETVVLVEGVLLFRPPVNDYLEGRVFLHIGFDEMLKRARERDVPKYGEAFMQKYADKYIPIQKRYLQEHIPHKISDIVIDNNDYTYPKIIKP